MFLYPASNSSTLDWRTNWKLVRISKTFSGPLNLSVSVFVRDLFAARDMLRGGLAVFVMPECVLSIFSSGDSQL